MRRRRPRTCCRELAEQLRGRVLVAHNAAFDVRVLRQAFARAALEWPDPPVICTVSVARRFAPLQRRRGLAALAGALGVEVDPVHRALPDARTCARVFCALFGRLCANARDGRGRARAALARRGPPRPAAAARRPRGERPHLAGLPHEPGVYVFRDADGRPLYVGKSIDLRTRARSHFTSGAAWTADAEHVDHQATESELGALLLEDRLIKTLRPPGNVRGKASPTGTSTCAAAWTSRSRSSRSRASPPPGTRSASARCAGAPPRPSWSSSSTRCSGCATAGARCRAASTRRPTARWAAASRPACDDLDPNLYRERLDAALRLFVGGDGGAALLARVDAQIARGLGGAALRARGLAAAPARPPRGAARRASGGCCARSHTGARLVLAPHPEAAGRFDAIWIAGGRVVDWGPVRARGRSGEPRSARAFARAPAPGSLGGWLPADAVAEARLVGAWIAANQPPALELGAGRGRRHTPPSSPEPVPVCLRARRADSVKVSVFA